MVASPAANAAYGDERTYAAIRTAMVLVESSWSARSASAVSTASTTAGSGRRRHALVSRCANDPVRRVEPNSVGMQLSSRRAASIESSCGWRPASTWAAIAIRPIGDALTSSTGDSACSSSAVVRGHLVAVGATAASSDQRSSEDVWFLVRNGRLPDVDESNAFRAEVARLRAIPEALVPVLGVVAGSDASMLSKLRSVLSVAASPLGLSPVIDVADAFRREQTLRLAALVPSLLAALHRIGQGTEPIEPDASLGHAASYLYQTTGVVPTPVAARAVEQCMILTIDHGFNASTFTARVVASTGADPADALCAALGALAGPLHGGAPSRAHDALDEIGSVDHAPEWVRGEVAGGRRIMGFGHAVYRAPDPRSALLREVAERLGGDLVEFATAVEAEILVTLAELKPGRPLPSNVEFYAGCVGDRRAAEDDVHADVRRQSHRRLVRPHRRAGGRRQTHPPQLPLRRPTPALTPAGLRRSWTARNRQGATWEGRVALGVVSDRITPEVVAKVAKLARLSLSDGELQQATHQLSDMLDHFADIDALDLDGVEPMTHPTPIANVMREDIEMDCLDRDEVLAAAPAAEDGRFRVPPIVGLED